MTGDGFLLFAEHNMLTKYKSILLLLDNHQSDFRRRHSGPSHSLKISKKQHQHRVRPMWFSYMKTFLHFGPKWPSSEVAQHGTEWFTQHSIQTAATDHAHYIRTKDILSTFGDITCEDLHTLLLRRIYNIWEYKIILKSLWNHFTTLTCVRFNVDMLNNFRFYWNYIRN